MIPSELQKYLDRIALELGRTVLNRIHSDMEVERMSAQLRSQAVSNDGPIDPNNPPPPPPPPPPPLDDRENP